MKGFYTQAASQIKGVSGNFQQQHLVRARTGSGEWAGVYVVSPDGGCHLLGRTTRWEPLKAVRARVNSYLGTFRKEPA